MGFELVNAFIDHLYTRLGITSNYSATANLHNSQITTAPAKPFSACCVFTSRSLAMASNSGDSSASLFQILSS
jgi:streptolysin S family bacteriocin protoxin